MINDTPYSMTMQTETKLSTTIPIADALIQIERIEYEQRLICEQIYRIDIEKQRLQQLLNFLQSTKYKSNKPDLQRRHYEIHSTDSESEYDSDD